MNAQPLEELETALIESGMPRDEIEAFKTRVKKTHMESQNAQDMPGNSFEITRIALEWKCDLEVKFLLADFADRYHLWVAENEAVLVAEDFEIFLKKFEKMIPMEEIEVVLKKMRHTASQCKDPRNVKLIYMMLSRQHIIPNMPTLDAAKLHMMINSFLVWLIGKCDEMGDPIFRNRERIEAWLELEENVRTPKSIPGSLQVLKAVRERDTEALSRLMKTPDGRRSIDERTYRTLLPNLVEQLD